MAEPAATGRSRADQAVTGQALSRQAILVVGPSWVGDMVMAQTLFIILKARYPDAAIEVLAPGWSRPILARMPEINAAIVMPVGHGRLDLLSRWRVAQTLRTRHYQAAYVLPNSLKSALIPLLAGIPRRVGWRGEMRFGLLNDIRLLDEERYPLMVQRFAALAYRSDQALPATLPRPRLQVDTSSLPGLFDKFGLDVSRPILALCPGAEFGPAKRWPEQHYRAVAETMIERGWQVWIMGSNNDEAVGEAIRGPLTGLQQQRVINLAGQTELADAIDLLSCAAVVVSNDSGLMHIAAALNRPLVAVYGSTSPGFTPPLGEQVETLAIPVDCGPCFQRACPLQHLKCLNDLLPGRVQEAIDRLLDARAERG